MKEIEYGADIAMMIEKEGPSYSSKAGPSKKSRKVETGSCSERTKRRHSSETLEIARIIHGGEKRRLKATVTSLVDTLRRCCSADDLVGSIDKSKKLMEKVFPKLHKKAVDGYEHTSNNMLRSIAIYYS